ncbi:MAG: LysR family transcriptional regulator [Alphaproteobacteria bacterium]|nr:LysR family transcriptional regulator [Alphaproteobacteria bacterium]
MDIQLAKTFLEVVATGSFVAAAKRLYVTQSAVSMRVKTLEDQIGRTLFQRSKHGAELTHAGDQFHRYAISMMRLWEEAQQQVAIPPGYRTTLRVGGFYSLWVRLLIRWLAAMQERAPDVAIRAELGMPDRLMRMLLEGIIDIGVMYTPQLRPGLEVKELLEDQLVLVSADKSVEDVETALATNYVYIDWGQEFFAAHGAKFAGFQTPGVTLGLGALGLNYILRNGKSGYFPGAVVQPHLDSGDLVAVADAPIFSFPVYVVSHTSLDPELRDMALETLQNVADIREEAQAEVIEEQTEQVFFGDEPEENMTS